VSQQTALELVLAAGAAVSGGGMTWLVARRRSSGTVATSEASDLWTEGQLMRADLRAEVVSLRDDVQRLGTQLDEMRRDFAIVNTTSDTVREENAQLRQDNQALRDQVARLRELGDAISGQ
jgi:hypothetical protein